MIKAKSHGNLTKLHAVSDNNANINLGFITPIHQQLECAAQYTDQTKEFAACALSPILCDEEEITTLQLQLQNPRNYWYEASQYCNITRERYVSLLQKVRKKKRRNSH
jgi:hypothetical protein